MTENPYAAPQAELLDKRPAHEGGPEELYVVSKKKLILLFLSTFSLYLIYWYYKNFSNLKKAFGESSWPVLRAIFGVFFTHVLYARIDEIAKARGVEHPWAAMWLATLLVALIIADAIGSSFETTWGILLGFVLLPIYLYPLLKAQTVINLSQNDPAAKRNSKFTWANYAWILAGLFIFWPFIIADTLDMLDIIDFY